MIVTLDQLAASMKRLGSGLTAFLDPINEALTVYDIGRWPSRVEMFLATIAHETGGLRVFSENLNYDAAGLCRVWPGRFAVRAANGDFVLADGKKVPNLEALALARKPQAIANTVYANRGGNGDKDSGDGWTFRGAGAIQLTFRDTHTAAAREFHMEPVEFAAWAKTPQGAILSAGWFWQRAGCNQAADTGNFDHVCDRINGGKETARYGDAIGFADRAAMWQLARAAIPGGLA